MGDSGAEELGGIRRDHVAVGVGDVDLGAGGAESVGDHVAGNLRTSQEDAPAGERLPGGESFDEAFGNVALGDERDGESFPGERFCGGCAYGGDAGRHGPERDAQFPCPGGNGADGVGAGKEEPVIAGEIAEGAVERVEADGRLDFEEWDFDRLGAEGAKAGGEFAGLVRGTRDENAAAGERLGLRGHAEEEFSET